MRNGLIEPVMGAVATAFQSTAKQSDRQPFFSIRDLAERWCCSRAAVYNWIRGEKVLDFAEQWPEGA